MMCEGMGDEQEERGTCVFGRCELVEGAPPSSSTQDVDLSLKDIDAEVIMIRSKIVKRRVRGLFADPPLVLRSAMTLYLLQQVVGEGVRRRR